MPPLQQDKSRIPSSVYSTDAAQRDSRIASSLYSQPSPTLPPDNVRTSFPQRKGSVGGEISPVSTPRSTNFPVGSDTSTVSPIETSFPVSARSPLPEQGFKSHIPRPVPTGLSRTPPDTREKKEDTKWDEYSGEPTAAQTGKRGSIRLSKDQLEMQFPQLKERTKQILAGLRDSDSKKPAWGRPPPAVEDSLDAPMIQQRPPWKGASGREAVVDPVRNNPGARKGPLHIPQRNISRDNPVVRTRTQSPEVTALPSSPSMGVGLQPVREPSPVTEVATTPRPDHSIRLIPSQESVKPVAPLKTREDKRKSESYSGYDNSLHGPFQNPSGQMQLPPNAETDHGRRVMSVSADDYSTKAATPPPRSALRPDHNQALQPVPPGDQDEVSRFSWTTHGTTVTDSPPSMQATIDSSPVPPMPPLSNPRSRPAPSSASRNMRQYSNNEARLSSTSIASRKPVGDRRRSSSMQSSTAKDLPPPPPPEAVPAGDKVDILEARQAQLAGRKRNNGRIRAELTEALRRNAIIYDIFKRRDVEGRIKELERERDEITNEEHEVGVLLHRAQKKRDNADEYESNTTLWITRMTQ